MTTSRLREILLDPRALAAPIFIYGAVRAARLSITHDEALTYLLHVRASWGAVVAHAAPLPSNNHLLNTLAVKSLLAVLPPTELVLRLPALLGLALFLWAAQRLLRGTATGVRRPLGFLLLAGNPFVLDLLVVSRGYALALGLSLAALALLLGDRRRPGAAGLTTAGCLAALAAALAVVANLAFLYAFTSLAAAAAWVSLPAGAAASRRSRITAPLRAAAPFAVAAALLSAVYTAGVLARIQRVVSGWGGDRGVWQDSVGTVADGALYGAPWFGPAHAAWVGALTVLAAGVLAAGVALAAVAAARRRGAPPDPTGRALAACVVAVTAWLLQASAAHALAGLRFPVERAASVLAPLLTLLFVLIWETAAASRRGAAAAVACTALAAAALVHFAACANLSHTLLWRPDADMRSAMRAVAPAAAAAPREALRLGVSWQLEPAANFYRVTRGLDGLAPVTRAEPRTGFDLYLLTADDAGLIASLGLRRCVTFAAAGTVLAAAPGIPCPPPA